jgi:hypothetical protein
VKYPCDGFAAFIARLLAFSDSPFVEVDAGTLYTQITGALAYRFAYKLLLYSLYASRMSREEAAERYWDATVARRLLLTGRVALSMTHHLFEALCRRGSDSPWGQIVVRRERLSAADDIPDAFVPASFAACVKRLSELPDVLSPHSASATIRTREGPLVLRMGGRTAVVQEELSIWDAVVCAPGRLHALSPGEPFNRFCGVVIDCVRTTHRPFMEVVRLGRGLCPFDWLESLTTSQTRHLVQFLNAVKGSDTPAAWDLAWQQAPVPGFESAAELWRSDIGLALRHATSEPIATDARVLEEEPGEEGDSEVLSEKAFVEQLDLLLADDLIDQNERQLLMALYNGIERRELLSVPGVRIAMRRRAMTLEALLDDLESRIRRWKASTPATEPT